MDENGKLKPFRIWKEEVASIASHFVGPWLQTEYNTAVIRAHNAADWLNFERNKDIFPNLRWMPTTSPNPEESHRLFWERKVTRPINDPFWNKHRPGDRWNCKCTLEATDDPITDIPGETNKERPQPGLKENPAKTKQIFDKSHPYFPKSCKECKFNKGFKNKLKSWFTNAQPNCNTCKNLAECLRRTTLLANEKKKRLDRQERKEVIDSINKWCEIHLKTITVNGQIEKLNKVKVGNETLNIRKEFFRETYSKNKNNRFVAETMQTALEYEKWISNAVYKGVEPGRHHSFDFRVYEATYKNRLILFKVKDNGTNNIYTMRFI